MALVSATPALALAQRPRLALATGAIAPLVSSPGRDGFLDLLAKEVFGRIGLDVSLVPMPVERALMNANAGVEDGDFYHTAGMEKKYPNLVLVPEKLMDFDLIAYAKRADIQVRSWGDLSSYSVAYITGWQEVQKNVKSAREVTTVRRLDQLLQLLAADRVDVIVLGRTAELFRRAREAGLTLRPMSPPLARVPMFMYLHRRHEALVQPLAAALVEVKRDGTWQKLFDQTLKPRAAAAETLGTGPR